MAKMKKQDKISEKLFFDEVASNGKRFWGEDQQHVTMETLSKILDISANLDGIRIL
ncbi:MAG: hypothetical protein HQK96_03030 [Nitrospirae bacterium]|nr:hypothetical protein [Nitrospirota bacterium]